LDIPTKLFPNVISLGEVADFGKINYQLKINIMRNENMIEPQNQQSCQTSVMHCAWKYTMLIGIFSLILEVFYMIISFIIYGNTVQPLWTARWLGISILFIFSSLFIAIIVNYKIIYDEIRDFLRCA